jgi:uncharacterized protein
MKYLSNKSIITSTLLSLFLLFSSFSFSIDHTKPLFEQDAVPALIQDYAQFLSKEQDKKLEIKLNKLSRESSTQILFVTVDDLMGYDKNDYASRLGIKWEVGGKEDNGIVFLVVPKQANKKGEVSIQVGYGLEGVIPDIVAKRIIEHEVIPNFKNGKYYRGVDAAINVLMDLSLGEYPADKYLERNGGQSSGAILPFIFIIFFTILFFVVKVKSTQRRSIGSNIPFWVAMGMMSSGNRSSSGSFSNFTSGGGSFGGGGFGGFGGGSFGGGGAGGSW